MIEFQLHAGCCSVSDGNTETVSVSSNLKVTWQTSRAGKLPFSHIYHDPFHWLFLHATNMYFSKSKSFHIFSLFLGKHSNSQWGLQGPSGSDFGPFFQPCFTLLFSQSCPCASAIIIFSFPPRGLYMLLPSVCNSPSHSIIPPLI